MSHLAWIPFDRAAGGRPTMPEPAIGPPSPRSSPDRRRVLLVDDNAEGRRALARLLELHDFEVTAAADGTSALAALQDVPPPEIVVTDLFLPDIDGREIARAAHDLVPQPVVVMITGWDFGRDMPDREAWGIDHLFLKPLNVTDLVTFLRTEAGTRD